MNRRVPLRGLLVAAAAICVASTAPVFAEWAAPIDAPAEPPPKLSPTFEVPLRDVDRFILPTRFTGLLAMTSGNKSGTAVVDLRRTGQERVRLAKGQTDAESALLSDDGLSIVMGHRNGIERRSLETNIIERTVPLEDADEVRLLATLPNGLVAAAIERDNRTSLEIYDLQTMKRTLEVPLDREASLQASVSPTGKLLAVADGRSVRLIDSAASAVLGEVAIPGAASVAFSPDGKELAVLVGGRDQGPGLTVLNAADGLTIKSVPLSQSYPRHVQHKDDIRAYWNYGDDEFAMSPAIQWMPDGDGWLLGGRDFLDREGGKVFYTLDVALAREPVLLIDRDRVAMATTNRGPHGAIVGRFYKAVTWPKEDFDAMRAAVRAGDEPGDAKLPPLTAAKWTAVKSVEPPAGDTPWSLAPDPAPPAKPGVGDFSVPLPPNVNLAAIGMAPPETGVALALTFGYQDEPLSPGGPRELEVLRLDLTNGASQAVGKVRASQRISEGALSIATTPDARHVLIKSPRPNGDRLDLWSLSDGGRHVVGWRPDSEAGERARILWMAALDESNVITASERGDIVLWSLPACEVVWIARTAPGSPPALSGGRKYLALGTDSGPLVIDARTGATLAKADLMPWQPNSASERDNVRMRVAFDPTGQRLEARGFVDGHLSIVGIHLADGSRGAPLVIHSVQSWRWLDDRFALINRQEICDTLLRAHVWSFSRPPSRDFEDGFEPVFAGRYWMITRNPPTLHPFPLVSDAIREAIDQADRAMLGVILRKGDRVALDGETGDNKLDRLWVNEATKSLLAKGVSVDAGARLKLVCTRKTNIGKTETYLTRRPGRPGVTEETVQGRSLKFELQARVGSEKLYGFPQEVWMPQVLEIPESSSLDAEITKHMEAQSPDTVKSLAEMVPVPMVSQMPVGQSLFPVPPEVLAANGLVQNADGTWSYVTREPARWRRRR